PAFDFSAPWQVMQCSAKIGLICFSKYSSSPAASDGNSTATIVIVSEKSTNRAMLIQRSICRPQTPGGYIGGKSGRLLQEGTISNVLSLSCTGEEVQSDFQLLLSKGERIRMTHYWMKYD